MPGLNITRQEALERSTNLTVDSYEVLIDVTGGRENFLATTKVKFSSQQEGYNTFIDAAGKAILAATLNGEVIDTSNYDNESLILNNLKKDNELIVNMQGIYSKDGEGLQLSVDPADDEVYLYSQGETAYIRKMYPCFDQPDLKAKFTFTVIAPEHWEVISNSPVIGKENLGDNKVKWSFAQTLKISTYVTALVAGPYHHVHDEYQSSDKVIPMGIYCRKTLADKLDAENIFELTKQGFAFFEKAYGLAYPFEKYDQIAVVDFNWGAMENIGAVTFREELLVFRSKVTERLRLQRAMVIFHEMAHMWFGNMVTMKWWEDLWLNESFAELSGFLGAAEGTRFTGAWTYFNVAEKNWAYSQDQLITTHPIAAEMPDLHSVNANFDGISYAKGASVLQQLIYTVGRDNFMKGIQNYFKRYAFTNTTLKDFIGEIENASGKDLTSWVHTWIQTAGVNTLTPQIEETEGKYANITINQEVPKVPSDSKELRPHRIAVGLYDLENGKLVRRKSFEFDLAGQTTHLPELVGEKTADLFLINDRDLSYTKIRFDQRSIQTLKEHFSKIDDSLTRSLCYSAIWNMHRDGEIASEEYIDIALGALANETEISIATPILMHLNASVQVYSKDAARDSLRSKVATRIMELLLAAPAGGDMQLQLARDLCNFARDEKEIALIQKILDGQINGLEADVDLRWRLLYCLVERGLFGEKEINAERERDNSYNGEMNFHQALATRPEKAAKDTAWNRILNEELTNALRASLIAGFLRPNQRELVAQYVDSYFENINYMWGKKSREIADAFIDGLFPLFLASEELLAKLDKWIADNQTNAEAGLMRMINENRDNLVRALKVKKA